MSEFTIRGTFQTHRGERAFETTIDATNENVAREHTFANFGGRHGLNRQQVEIEEVEAQ
ncbi:50S ribosomal protein L18a [Halorubellus sp. JP-L1]|uniref:50S ribosomal protein L18Ae n=1 Tax=Halorubellus sp. JP-L1 TaxID=2715753 RepID=UPI00140C93F9|nr:50S ribosomal protein L18Ae [Halorubellus sp. JP-L1]NHN43572.1 50S ribosomal protein L18a [Halorubellus sp. JP-L1]